MANLRLLQRRMDTVDASHTNALYRRRTKNRRMTMPCVMFRRLDEENCEERLEGVWRTLEETRRRALAAYDGLVETRLQHRTEWETKAAADRAELVEFFDRAEAMMTFMFASAMLWVPDSHIGQDVDSEGTLEAVGSQAI